MRYLLSCPPSGVLSITISPSRSVKECTSSAGVFSCSGREGWYGAGVNGTEGDVTSRDTSGTEQASTGQREM